MIIGYQYVKTIYKGNDTIIYRAIAEDTEERVIIKASLLDYPSSDQLEEFKREIEYGALVSKRNILPFTLCYENSPNRRAFLLAKDIPFITLNEYMNSEVVALGECLEIAIQITKLLSDVHHQRLIQQCITPSTIYIASTTKELIFTDFRFSTPFSRTISTRSTTRLMKQAAPYISPEQTGRIGRLVDYRTDFYSLGITLYELLTGRNPYKANDYLEWIHAHIGKKPPAPFDFMPHIPKSISDIVMKLLSKNPNERYQSTFGLLEDLKTSSFNLEQNDRGWSFQLGQHDCRADLSFSASRFVGRLTEQKQLLNSFERVKNGQVEFALISGSAGVGKTALVQSCFERRYKEGYQFISGKCERGEDKPPYGPLIQALTSYIHNILARGSDYIKYWKNSLIEELGDNIALIADFIPDICLIVGETGPVEPLPFLETENRFRNALHGFIKCMLKTKEPMILFLDDLHWMDRASYEFIKDIVNHDLYSYLFVIGTYRSEETKENTMLSELISILQQSQKSVKELYLADLTQEEVHDWLEIQVPLQQKDLQLLSKELYTKTLGNPLFLQRSLQVIYDNRLLYFNHYSGKWLIKNQDFNHFTIADNVIDLMIQKLSSFSESVLTFVQVASCIGNSFDLKLVQKVGSFSSEEVVIYVNILIKEGLIIENEERLVTGQSENSSFIFAHDEVWRATYSQLSDEEKQKLHWVIGKSMAASNQKNAKPITYACVEHLNKGINLITDEKEKEEIARFNLEVGNKALAEIAYYSANTYFKTGLKWLGNSPWEKRDLCFELTFSIVKCLYLLGNELQAETELNHLLNKSENKEEKVRILQLQSRLMNRLKNPQKMIDTTLEGTKLLGYHFPRKTNKLKIALELVKVKRKLKKLSMEDLFSSKQDEEDEKQRLLFSMLETLGVAVYSYDKNLYGLHILKAIQLHYPHFRSPLSALSLCEYALLESEGLGNYRKSYRLGKASLRLAQKKDNTYINGIVTFIFGGFINHWGQSLESSRDYLQEAFELNRQAGNHLVAGGALVQLVNTEFMCGTHLDKIGENLETKSHSIKELRHEEFDDYFTFVRKLIELIKQKKQEDEQEVEAMFFHLKNRYIDGDGFKHYISLAMISYWFYTDDHEKVIAEGDEMFEYLQKNNSVLGASGSEFSLYHTLSICAVVSSNHKKYKKIVKTHRHKLKKWSQQAENNFGHRYLLIEAAWLHWQKKTEQAINMAMEAAELAESNQFIQHQALSMYYLGKLMMEIGKDTLAQKYLKQAYFLYNKWGAKSFANSIANTYKLQVTTEIHEDAKLPSIDGISLIKASHVLSKEIILEKVLTKLMEIVLENAAAERGFLLLDKDGELYVEVEAQTVGDQINIQIVDAIPLQQFPELPLSVVCYTRNLKQEVICDHLYEDKRFVHDDYVKVKKPKSALSLPISKNGQLVGVLYLENNLATHAFTKENVMVLELLTTQAVISIENARLYNDMQTLNEHLEEKVQERTRYLEQSQKEFAEALAEKSVLEERNRIAREIHDVIGHTLTTTIVQIEASKRLFLKDKEHALEKLDVSQQLIRKGLDDIRYSVKLLNEDTASFDLIHEMNELIDQTVDNTSIKIDRMFPTQLPKLSLSVKKMFYHALQEGLTNGIRHGNSTYFHATLIVKGDRLLFTLEDHGTGTNDLKFGFGLHSMKERVEELNGEIIVTSSLGTGTTISISVQAPMTNAADRRPVINIS